MRRTSIFAVLLLAVISFGIVGGCKKNGGNDRDNDPSGVNGFDLELAIELGELAP